MNKLILAGAALAALIAQPALAADMPVKVPYRAPPPYSWTGCYLGFNFGAGYARVSDTWTPSPAFGLAAAADIAPPANGSLRPGRVLGGGTVGCNYQTGVAVWGIEGDFDGSRLEATLGTTTPVFGNTISESVKSRWLGTARGRLGYSNAGFNSFGNWMLYVTAGAAFADLQFTDTIFFPGFPGAGTTNTALSTQTKVGWTAGFGGEWQTIGNWTMKFELLYVDLGQVNTTSFNSSPALAAFTIGHAHNFTEYVAKFGFNYRFGGYY
jgi:outer membrane immunogenic protein